VQTPRPEEKPPFAAAASSVGPDLVPISSLTLMRAPPWQALMSKRNKQGLSYRAHVPEECARILEGILNGVPVDYEGDRSIDRYGPNLKIDPAHVPKVDAVIKADVAAGKKAGPFAVKPFPVMCISPIGCVPKKNSEKVRVIHHLSFPHGGDSVNATITEIRQSLPRFGHAARAISKLGLGAWLIKLDVSAAYKQIPVRREDWPLLGFLWDSKYYYERVLPFGLRSSCRLWDLYAAALHFFLDHFTGANCEHEVIHYVDDFLFVVEPGKEEEAKRMLTGAMALCEMLGLPLAPEKTEGPVQCLTFLGIELDTLKLESRLPASRLAELKLRMVEWGSRTHATVKELQSIAGLLNFACSVVPPGRYFLRRIIDCIKGFAAGKAPPYAKRELGPEVQLDFAWWRDYLPQWNGVSMLYEAEWTRGDHLELATDACDTGFGGHWGRRWFSGTWAPSVWGEAMRGKRSKSMPFCELYALVAAATLWGEQWRGMKVTFLCDCQPIVQAVAKCSSKSSGVMHLLRVLCGIACRCGFDFKVEHIAGASNTIADFLSRYGDCQEFRDLCPHAMEQATALPDIPLPSPAAPEQQPKARELSPLTLLAQRPSASWKPPSAREQSGPMAPRSSTINPTASPAESTRPRRQ